MDEIDRCRSWIEAALARGIGGHTFDDIAQMIRDGRVQLWPAPNGCLVTEIVTYPRCKVLNVFLGGGEIGQLADMHEAVIAWGKAMGCTKATIQGRKGWSRAFAKHGWKDQHAVLVKEFDK